MKKAISLVVTVAALLGWGLAALAATPSPSVAAAVIALVKKHAIGTTVKVGPMFQEGRYVIAEWRSVDGNSAGKPWPRRGPVRVWSWYKWEAGP